MDAIVEVVHRAAGEDGVDAAPLRLGFSQKIVDFPRPAQRRAAENPCTAGRPIQQRLHIAQIPDQGFVNQNPLAGPDEGLAAGQVQIPVAGVDDRHVNGLGHVVEVGEDARDGVLAREGFGVAGRPNDPALEHADHLVALVT